MDVIRYVGYLASGHWPLGERYVSYLDESNLLHVLVLQLGLQQKSLMLNSRVWLFVYILSVYTFPL